MSKTPENDWALLAHINLQRVALLIYAARNMPSISNERLADMASVTINTYRYEVAITVCETLKIMFRDVPLGRPRDIFAALDVSIEHFARDGLASEDPRNNMFDLLITEIQEHKRANPRSE